MAVQDLTARGSSSALGRYGELLRVPGVAGLVLAMIVARLPTGSFSMLLVLCVSEPYGAALAGAASAAWTIGLALAAPLLGRLVDQGRGPATLRVSAMLECVVFAWLLFALATGAPAAVLLTASFACGALNPPVAGATRSAWPLVVEGELLETAYSFEILVVDVLYVTGPMLAGAFMAAGACTIGMIVVTAGLVVGSFALSWSAPVRRYAASASSRDLEGSKRQREVAQAAGAKSHKPGLLARPEIRALLLACMGAMMFSGYMETLIPLEAAASGNAAAGSIAISLWSIGSIVGVLGFVRLQELVARGRSRSVQLAAWTALYLLACVLACAVGSAGIVGLCATMTLVGLLVSPCTNLHYQLGSELAPRLRGAEMFSWINTATSAGISLGAFVAGMAAERLGSPGDFWIPWMFVALSLVCAIGLDSVVGRQAARSVSAGSKSQS